MIHNKSLYTARKIRCQSVHGMEQCTENIRVLRTRKLYTWYEYCCIQQPVTTRILTMMSHLLIFPKSSPSSQNRGKCISMEEYHCVSDYPCIHCTSTQGNFEYTCPRNMVYGSSTSLITCQRSYARITHSLYCEVLSYQ